HLVETGLRNWSIVLDLQQRCGTSATHAKEAAARLKKYFSTREELPLLHAARLWLILLTYQPPHAPVQSTTPSFSNTFVNECNDKDFLSTIQKLVDEYNDKDFRATIQKLVGDKTTRTKVSPKIILLFVRIVATAANYFGGEFHKMRPLLEATSPERV
ncbi:hypothetical protein FRC01_001792, partial [Tulasnella sp. 417]